MTQNSNYTLPRGVTREGRDPPVRANAEFPLEGIIGSRPPPHGDQLIHWLVWTQISTLRLCVIAYGECTHDDRDTQA